MRSDRRSLMAATAAAVGLGTLGFGWQRWQATRLSFSPLEDPAGFRRLDGPGSGVLGGFDPLAGIALGLGDAPQAPPALPIGDLCTALFGPQETGGGAVPVASFSDYRCPYCRILTPRLAQLEADGRVAVRWHEWPLLGSVSEVAARAALAASLQDAYAAFHARLMGSPFVPTEAYLLELAQRNGLDGPRLVADMASPEVARDIDVAKALARRFGCPGTPALVVGRTVVVGAIPPRRLAALIRRETEDGPVKACV